MSLGRVRADAQFSAIWSSSLMRFRTISIQFAMKSRADLALLLIIDVCRERIKPLAILINSLDIGYDFLTAPICVVKVVAPPRRSAESPGADAFATVEDAECCRIYSNALAKLRSQGASSRSINVDTDSDLGSTG